MTVTLESMWRYALLVLAIGQVFGAVLLVVPWARLCRRPVRQVHGVVSGASVVALLAFLPALPFSGVPVSLRFEEADLLKSALLFTSTPSDTPTRLLRPQSSKSMIVA